MIDLSVPEGQTEKGNKLDLSQKAEPVSEFGFRAVLSRVPVRAVVSTKIYSLLVCVIMRQRTGGLGKCQTSERDTAGPPSAPLSPPKLDYPKRSVVRALGKV